jgi:small basic protein
MLQSQFVRLYLSNIFRGRTAVEKSYRSMRRAILGILGGASFCGAVAVAIPSLLFGAALLFADIPPIDRARSLDQFPGILAFCGISGMILGALAGLASRLPRSGVPFLRCCILIALPTGVVRFFTALHAQGKEPGPHYLSYIASFLAAVIVTCVLVWIGVVRGASAHSEDLPT